MSKSIAFILSLPLKVSTRTICDSNLGNDPSQADLDNHADQMNPNNNAYWDFRTGGEYDDDNEYDHADLDNHDNQMNPNNDAYLDSRDN